MDFQVIIMAAGRGSRMTELTSGQPKCLLPIGNLPLLAFSINFLEKHGFQEAIVIVPDNLKTKVFIPEVLSLKLEFVPLPSNEDYGTADSLRFIQDKITKDFIVLSCDTLTDVSLDKLVNLHRIKNSALTILLSPVASESTEVPNRKSKGQRNERDIVGIEEETSRLLFLNSEADFEDSLPIKTSLVKKHPHFKITSKLEDSHIYIFSRTLLPFICSHENVSSIKGELLPLILKQQFVKNNLSNQKNKLDKKNQIDYNELLHNLSSSEQETPPLITCYAMVMQEGFCSRVNTIASYAEANKQIKTLAVAYETIFSKSNSISGTYKPSVVSNDCLVGEGTEISNSATVKRSVVGKFCKLNDKAKVVASVLMEGVEVEEHAILMGCILGANAIVGKNCELKDCIVGKGQRVADNKKLVNQKILAEVHEFMEI